MFFLIFNVFHSDVCIIFSYSSPAPASNKWAKTLGRRGKKYKRKVRKYKMLSSGEDGIQISHLLGGEK